jgi:membrane associated rhomboid family serine protease
LSKNNEKAINLPSVISALLLLFIGLQLLKEYGPLSLSQFIYQTLAFVPERLSNLLFPQIMIGEAPYLADHTYVNALGPTEKDYFSFFTLLTYAFLHANWTHLLVNSLTLAAFGAPVARRLGPINFLNFMALCAVAGALTHYFGHMTETTPIVGASAAISGAIAGTIRFAFDAPTSQSQSLQAKNKNEGALKPLNNLLSNRSAVIFMAVWLVSNFVIGVFPHSFGIEGSIAWEAHLGGFLSGLFLFGFFDPVKARTL